MPFAVLAQKINGFEAIILTDSRQENQAIILPDYGAMLHSFIIKSNVGPLNVIDNYSSREVLEAEITNGFKSCKLSPFACRIPGGEYTYHHHSYQLEKTGPNGSSIHGLLYNKGFYLTDQFNDDNQARVCFKYDYNRLDDGYPFDYSCEVCYTLMADNLLQVQTTIINTGADTIPLADGWHPYFTLGGKVDDWILQFNASTMLEFNEKLVPTGKVIQFKKFLIPQPLDGITLDNSFVLDGDFKNAACTLLNPLNSLSVSFFPDESYPYLQIYIPPGRTSIAIENLSGAPNCFNNNIGLIHLSAGDSKTFTTRYKTNSE